MDGIREKDFKEENQIDICTDNCAIMHRFLCIPIKSVKLKIQKMKVNFEEKQKTANGRFYDHPLFSNGLQPIY
jgi:hypothetical protein